MKLTTVTFHSNGIDILDDRFISIKSICSNLGIDNATQNKKIQLDESFESKFEDVEINGIIQSVLCIPLSKLNGWLFSINPNRVKPEVKQKLIEYKNECFDVLYNHFNKTPKQLPHAETNPEIEKYKKTILGQNALIANLYNELQAKPKQLPHADKEVEDLKKTLIKLHDGYHRILMTCSPIDMMKELSKMTSLFQLIKSSKTDTTNLNTQTVAGHSYWGKTTVEIQQNLQHRQSL